MRRYLLSMMAVWLLACVTPVRGEELGITTTGTATVYAVPDVAVFSVSIMAVDADTTKASARNEADGGKLVKAMKAAGIADTDIATDMMAIGVHYREQGPGQPSVRDGFQAVRTYSAKLRDLKQIQKVFDAIVQAGVEALPNVDLQVSNTRSYRDQARLMAVRAAQQKAVAMAKELNLAVGKALNIVEGTAGRDYRAMMIGNNARMDSADPVPDTPESTPIGRVEIQATVTVTFELK